MRPLLRMCGGPSPLSMYNGFPRVASKSREQTAGFCFSSFFSFLHDAHTPRLALGFLQDEPIPTKWRSLCQRKGHPPQVSARKLNTHSPPLSLTLQSSRGADLGGRPLGTYVTIAMPPLENRLALTRVL